LAGHNKWSKIRHRKAIVDKRRSKVWTQVARAIMVAARQGGGDPGFNTTLRYALDEARYANMPRDVIERAIAKGAGGGDTTNYEAMRYEGYGPGGVAVIVDALTDNRTRTVTDVRNAFGDHGGNMGASGCVAYMFQPRGVIVVTGAEDAVMEAALEAGAIDVQPADDDGAWVVVTDVAAYIGVKDALEKAKLKVGEASLTMIPETTVAVNAEHAGTVAELIEALEDLDDVQKVYSNVE